MSTSPSNETKSINPWRLVAGVPLELRTRDEQLVVWMTRRDGQSGRMLDFRDGCFPLQVKNTSGDVVATFEVTLPSPPTFPTWSAVPLPATKTNGDLDVTLNAIDVTLIDNKIREFEFFVKPPELPTDEWPMP